MQYVVCIGVYDGEDLTVSAAGIGETQQIASSKAHQSLANATNDTLTKDSVQTTAKTAVKFWRDDGYIIRIVHNIVT